MTLTLHSVLLLALGMTVYQDFKARSIFWWLPVVIAFSSGAIAFTRLGWQGMFTQFALNVVFCVLIISTVALYVLLKYKTLNAFTSERFGLGDILILLAICPLMPLLNFVVFLCLSNLIMLLIEVLLRITVRQNVRSIPYAGYLALFLAILTLCTFFIPDINFQADLTGYFLLSGI